jgi:transposase
MEEFKGLKWVARSNKNEHYDKRLIREVLEHVYAGVPRKELVIRYGLSYSSIGRWLQEYGSADYQSMKRKSYSMSEKRTVVTAIETGRMTAREARIAHGIKSEKTIRDWIAAFEREKTELCVSAPEIMSSKKTEKPSEDIEALRKELVLAELKIKALNVMIDIAEDQLKIDIRKKSGARQSGK